ncbi:AarF/ABC1/UbiB kinase family protein [Niallia sp. XMNu-256]|uniref:ABC1 kinase family protein n=1 Tax=Niallia sp. XMNu-256 TaxID=3082444 RepID=UPI0030D2933C
MFGIRFKHRHRYHEITNAFLRNGFSYFVYRIGLSNQVFPKVHDAKERMSINTIGIKLRQVLQELGPTFIKIGQIASTRRDLVPSEIAEELEKLQDQVAGFPFQKVREIVEMELGESLENLFLEFDKTPIAAASIGQVHHAVLRTGEHVAIKVQRPDIRTTIETDLEILDDVARLMEANLAWAKTIRIRKMITEFANSLRAELDYGTEGRNGERIAKQFSDFPEVVIPKIYWDYTTNKVLTMDFIDGIKVSHVSKLQNEGYNLKSIANRVVNSMLHQILMEGFFHGDPHPGNVYILPGNKIAYIDFGMVGRLSEDTKFHFASLVIHLQNGNTKGLMKTITAMGLHSSGSDTNLLYNDVDMFVMKYSDVPLSQISIGDALKELLDLIYRHQIQVPADLSNLGKTLFLVESIVSELDPELSIVVTIKPFGEKLLRKRYEPKNMLKNSWSDIIETAGVIAKIPKNLKDLTDTIGNGKLHFEMSITEMKDFLQRMDRISNRLAFSIILLSFSILMVGLIIGTSIIGQKNLLWEFPAVEIGSIVATSMFLFILFAIIKSGRM